MKKLFLILIYKQALIPGYILMCNKELIVNVTSNETRVALVENGNIVELFIERGDDSNITGNIYKGRVQRVLPGMQAAFVDIGLKQAAFLYVDDVLEEDYSVLEQRLEKDAEDASKYVEDYPAEQALENNHIKENQNNTDKLMKEWTSESKKSEYKIEELIVEGQEILVQVAKSPLGSKGARVTSHISLPGRFMVLMPMVDHIGISRRIEDEAERARLKAMILSMRTTPFGYILRTASEGIQEKKLAREIGLLGRTWEKLQKKSQTAPVPSILHRDLNVTFKAVRDLLIDDADKLIIDSKLGYEKVSDFLNNIMPGLNVSIEHYNEPEPIFDAYNLEGDIARAMRKKIWLKSGGYIVIEHTEALVAIDVNTGRFVGQHNFEETVLKTNLEAVKEIAYQIRLRNLGGIIIIDFIDMVKPSNREKVCSLLKEHLKKDKSKTNVLPMSDLGLIQMTRKRVHRSLSRMLCEPCFYCHGDGILMSRKSVGLKICRELQRESRDMIGNSFTVNVNPEIAELLSDAENHLISAIEEKINGEVSIYPKTNFHLEEYEIIENNLQ